MASFVVMEPPGRAAEERAVIVRDGFHILAFLLPAIWLLVHRLWLETLAVVLAGLVIGLLGAWCGSGTASLASLMLALFVGLEGSALRVAALRRRGWREWGVVEAGDAREAEIRYLADIGHGHGARDTVSDAVPTAPVRTVQRPAPTRPVPALGMLGYPGRN
ncbi:DUF2628 domain-containing protein [Neoaquamicrobium sediminum]|uniref:DUF2628 domain-containing protein n=1 Tax=Neoaquamicrobium sediminum TaxID=1849104 RepID=UPI003BABED46